MTKIQGGGLYNTIFGWNPLGAVFVNCLGFCPNDFGRYRDAFVADGEIVVYTRCGGENREEYDAVFKKMRAHPLYLRDADDGSDATYCTFYFRLPEEFAEPLRLHDSGKWDPDARWKEALAALEASAPAEKPST